MDLRIGKHSIGRDSTPYIIAEIGVNHENRMDLAVRMIEDVASAGGSAAKFQTYKAERLASKYSPSYWDRTKEPSDSQFKLFQRYDKFGKQEYSALAAACVRVGIDFLSTPFDEGAVEMLAPLVPAFKIASADITNYPLLEAAASYRKPMILSTGASDLNEVDTIVAFLRKQGVEQLGLLHCVLAYPTPPSQAHLRFIQTLRERYPECVIGYSDHVPPDPDMLTLAAAYALGAAIIEKHFTWDKSQPGNDHYHAMDRADLQRFVSNVQWMGQVLGSREKRVLDIEGPARQQARRSLVAATDLSAGHRIAASDLLVKRPGTGLPPSALPQLLGRTLRRAVVADQLLAAEDLEPA